MAANRYRRRYASEPTFRRAETTAADSQKEEDQPNQETPQPAAYRPRQAVRQPLSKEAKSRLLAGAALAVTLLAGAIIYTVAFTVIPFQVANALPYMTSDAVALSMRPAITQSLADRTFTLVVEDKETPFRLGDYEFTASDEPDGSSREVTYKDSDGKTQTKTVTTSGNLCFNETAVRDFIYRLAKEHGKPMIAPYYKIKDDTLTVYKGTDGIGIDYELLINTILLRIRTGDNSPIDTSIIKLEAPQVDIDRIYSEVKCSPVDASMTLDAEGNPQFTDEIIGRDFDVAEARSSITGKNKNAKSWKIKLNLTYPAVRVKQLRAPYCLDVLSTCTTSYKGSSKARSNNVERAADNINHYGGASDGFIMQPGDEFSFNGFVGERTEANGFMKAPVYMSSGSTEDYGGGICQVSTTLYTAALYANLEITERHNHLYVIHYWKTAGCDATVDWGHLDFKFKNNKEYPIKIKLSYEEKQLTATITGTADGIKVELTRKISHIVPYQTRYKRPTADHPEGATSGGDRGETVKVWRRVYQNGKLISSKVESNNLYQPLTKTIYTKKLPAGAKYS